MTTTSTATHSAIPTLGATWYSPERDGYGRPVRRLYASHRGAWGQVAAVTTLPKTWVDSHGADRWVVSDLRPEAGHRTEPVHFFSLAKAKAYAETLLAPLTEDELMGLRAYETVVRAEADTNKLVEWARMHAEKSDVTDPANLHHVMRRICTTEINRRTDRRFF